MPARLRSVPGYRARTGRALRIAGWSGASAGLVALCGVLGSEMSDFVHVM